MNGQASQSPISNRDAVILAALPLVNYIAGRIGRRLPPQIDRRDLISEGVVAVAEDADRFNPAAGKLSTFFYKRIEGAIRNFIEAQGFGLPVQSEDYHAQIAAYEQRELLSAAIERLPERERLVVALYYYEGFTHREIAVVLGCTADGARKCPVKAIVALQAALGAKRVAA